MPLPSHPGGVPVRKNNERRKGPLHSVHEKAGQAEIRCDRFSKTGDANQWDAKIPASIPIYAIAESPRSHPHCSWSDCSGASWCPQFDG
jgi:hypothetical protein